MWINTCIQFIISCHLTNRWQPIFGILLVNLTIFFMAVQTGIFKVTGAISDKACMESNSAHFLQ